MLILIPEKGCFFGVKKEGLLFGVLLEMFPEFEFIGKQCGLYPVVVVFLVFVFGTEDKIFDSFVNIVGYGSGRDVDEGVD